ncbi:MAG: hypothetical protein EHM43_02540 [Ignavibacteriae bacterium]|nr:MAG: hypothetical protein EHM43_02540 [Ignavibacteriota bacterium]
MTVRTLHLALAATLALLPLLFSTASGKGLDGTIYQVTIDTRTVVNDQLPVEIYVPEVKDDSATFVFPVTIPGTYESHLWWRLVHNFRAFDAQGRPLPVHRSADSQFVISNAKKLRKVTYLLDDSFDDTDDRVSIFHPAGTSFQGDSVFVFNHGGMIGYLDGYQDVEYHVTVYKKPGLYTATSLEISHIDSTTDQYNASSFDILVDGPALICKPDTATFDAAGVKVLVALYHTKDKPIAKAYAKSLKEVTTAIASFLPSMPVDRYAFLLYLWDGDTNDVKRAGFAQGALEHSYSSLYFWRYTSRPFGLNDVAAHEFLHILMPLNLHSREIESFDFRNPQMSRHLWLYEGVTEYFAHQALLRADTAYMRSFNSTMARAARTSFDALPTSFSLIDFSKNVLTTENQSLYPLIYQYGPLNGLCLDILIREESGGKQGLLEVVYALMEEFGPSKPFEDTLLFDQLERVTSKKVRAYCDRYIAGTERLPLAEYLPKIGMTFKDSLPKERLSYGVDFDMKDGDERIMVGPKDSNPLGLVAGDQLMKIDSVDVSMKNPATMTKLFRVTDTPVTLTVLRDGTEVELAGKPVMTTVMEQHVIEQMKDVTPDVARFRRLVLFGRVD